MKKAFLWLILFLIVICAAIYFSPRPNEQDKMIKAETLKAVDMLQQVCDQAQKDGLTLEQAKVLGANKLRLLRYGSDNRGYFWADTLEGVNVVLYGRKDTEGRNRINDNAKGIYHVREIIINGQKPGGGYTDYYFPKMGEQIPIKKRAYSILFKPFNWVIGTGYYK